MRAIFGDKARDMKDTSLRVSSGENGKVIGVGIFRDNGDDLSPGVNQLVGVYVAQLRKLSIGDKMAGVMVTSVVSQYYLKKICHFYQMVSH